MPEPAALTKGLEAFSAPMVVDGPCPGHTSKESGSVKELIFDTLRKDRSVSTGEIRTPHTSLEQHVPPNNPLLLVIHKDHMSR